MIRVLKSEMKKYFYGKALYVCLFVVVLMPLMEYAFMSMAAIAGPGERITQAFIDQFTGASGDQIYKYLYYILFNGGSLFIVTAVMTTLIITEDYTQGTKKFILALSTRLNLASGKLLTLIVVNSLLHFTGSLTALAIAYITRGEFGSVYPIELLLTYTLIGWLVIMGYSSLIAVIGGFVRNVPGTLAIGLGVYLIGWGIAIYLPSTIRALIFMNGAMLIGEKTAGPLEQAIVVCSVSALVFSVLSHWRIRKQSY